MFGSGSGAVGPENVTEDASDARMGGMRGRLWRFARLVPAATTARMGCGMTTNNVNGVDRPLDILVLMGGPSSERDVSLASGEAVATALAARGHRVRRGDIRPTDTSVLDGDRPDVVFIALHGEFGEDGQVQQLCEDRRLAYVGSGIHASELTMDKAATKQIYRQAKLATPEWGVVEEFDTPARARELADGVGLPCVLKPIGGGSSVDIAIVEDVEKRDAALGMLLDRYSRAMVERFVAGREFTVGVLGDRALPAVEIRPDRAFYDYYAKYEDDKTGYIFDHGLDVAMITALREAALTSHAALGCRDMSRTDMIVDADGKVWTIETNTIPGFTPHSLLPKAACQAGIPMEHLCEQLVGMALRRKGLAICGSWPDKTSRQE